MKAASCIRQPAANRPSPPAVLAMPTPFQALDRAREAEPVGGGSRRLAISRMAIITTRPAIHRPQPIRHAEASGPQ